MHTIVIGVDCFASCDTEHPAVAVRRVGGAKYRCSLFGEVLERDPQTGRAEYHDFDTIEEAQEYARQICELVDAQPHLLTPAAVHSTMELAQARRKIAELEKRLTASEA